MFFVVSLYFTACFQLFFLVLWPILGTNRVLETVFLLLSVLLILVRFNNVQKSDGLYPKVFLVLICVCVDSLGLGRTVLSFSASSFQLDCMFPTESWDDELLCLPLLYFFSISWKPKKVKTFQSKLHLSSSVCLTIRQNISSISLVSLTVCCWVFGQIKIVSCHFCSRC